MSTTKNSINASPTNTTVIVGNGTSFSNIAYSATGGTSNIVSRDSNGNTAANNLIEGYATTTTSASTVTLTVSSAQQQYFTGSTNQTVLLPVTSTLVLGQSFTIVNNSTATVTVQSSGGNTIQAMASNTSLIVTCILTSGTTAASWNAQYVIESALTLPLSLANGGTNASLTASNGGIFYSTGTAGAILAGTATASQVLQSGATAAPIWSTATYPSTAATTGTILRANGTNWVATTATYPTTTTINQILYSSAASVISGLATANNAILNTSNTGVPSLATSPACSGTLTAGTGLTATTGNITASSGNLSLPTTTSSVGRVTVNGNSFLHAYGSDNAFCGFNTGNFTLTGVSNTGMGNSALANLTSSNYCSAFGSGALSAVTSGTPNTGIGYDAGNSIQTGTNNTCLGYYAGSSMVSTINCTLLGDQAGKSTLGNYNTCVGSASLFGQGASTNSCANNTAVGYQTLYNLDTGTDNAVFGYQAGINFTTGSYNTAIGDSAIYWDESGSYNTALGYQAGINWQAHTESSNIAVMNGGVYGESNVMRLGTTGSGNGEVNATYIAGAYGVTITGSALLMSSAGQIGTVVSSERYKENIEDIEQNITILNLKPKSFTYKKDPLKGIQYGLIAEDVDKEFPYLCLYNDEGLPDGVKYHELCTFLLIEVQRLHKKLETLERKFN